HPVVFAGRCDRHSSGPNVFFVPRRRRNQLLGPTDPMGVAFASRGIVAGPSCSVRRVRDGRRDLRLLPGLEGVAARSDRGTTLRVREGGAVARACPFVWNGEWYGASSLDQRRASLRDSLMK